jgi:hypothetical protein
MKNCDRCNQITNSFTMSRFNTDMICINCQTEEKNHKDFKKAFDEELKQIKENDNYNFSGIGLPDDLIEKSQIRKNNIKNIVDLSGDY